MAEAKVTEAAAGDWAPAIRAGVAQIVPIAGIVILVLYILVLSSAILPPFRVFVVFLVLAGVISWVLRRGFIKL